jgi:hypothetical protein
MEHTTLGSHRHAAPRADLYRYAAAIVGTASSAGVTRARSERALEWGLARQSLRRGVRAWFERSFAPPPLRASRPDLTGAFAGAHAGADRERFAHEQALTLVDELLLFAALEAVFALCLGCKVFALLMRAGVVPEEVCAECSDIWSRVPRPVETGPTRG